MSLRYQLACIMLLATASLVTSGCQQAEQTEQATTTPEVEVQEAAFNTAGNPTLEIEVPAIHCEGCAAGVARCLKEEPGVVDVTVDATTKIAKVAYEPSEFDADNAIDSLTEAKFAESTLVEAEETAAN